MLLLSALLLIKRIRDLRVGLEHATRHIWANGRSILPRSCYDQLTGGRRLICQSQLYWPTLAENTVGCPRLTQPVLVGQVYTVTVQQSTKAYIQLYSLVHATSIDAAAPPAGTSVMR